VGARPGSYPHSINPRALIRQALAHGNELDAATLLLRQCAGAEFIRALGQEFSPQLREWALTFAHQRPTRFRQIRSPGGEFLSDR